MPAASARRRTVASIVAGVSGSDAAIAAMYVYLHADRVASTPALDLARCAAAVLRWASADQRSAWRYPRNLREQAARQAAHNFVAEHRLFAWLVDANQSRGIAPSTRDLLFEYHRLWPFAGTANVDHTPAQLLAGSHSGQRTWALRWRDRWGVAHGRLQVRPAVDPEELRRKAFHPPGETQKWTPKRDPLFGAT